MSHAVYYSPQNWPFAEDVGRVRRKDSHYCERTLWNILTTLLSISCFRTLIITYLIYFYIQELQCLLCYVIIYYGNSLLYDVNRLKSVWWWRYVQSSSKNWLAYSRPFKVLYKYKNCTLNVVMVSNNVKYHIFMVYYGIIMVFLWLLWNILLSAFNCMKSGTV